MKLQRVASLAIALSLLSAGNVSAQAASGLGNQSATDSLTQDTTALYLDGARLEAASGGTVQEIAERNNGEFGVLRGSAKSDGDPFPQLTLLASKSSVQLSWTAVKGATGYDVLRNGSKLASTKSESWVDPKPIIGKSAQYTVEATTSQPLDLTGRYVPEPTFDEGAESYAQFKARQGRAFVGTPPLSQIPITDHDPAADAARKGPADAPPSTSVVSVSREVTVPSGASKSAAAKALNTDLAAAAASSMNVMRHTTFIPTSNVPGFPCAFNGALFGGDGRGFDIKSERYRTRFNIYADFAAGTIGGGATVHDSHLYDKNYKLLSVKNAGTSGMTVSRYFPLRAPVSTQAAESTMYVSVNHDVGNPFCVPPGTNAINYGWTARLDRAGGYSITGSHRAAPNHEIYWGQNWVKGDGNFWWTVYRREVVKYECLASVTLPGCSRLSISSSKGDGPIT